MIQEEFKPLRRRRLSLSVRVSLGLVICAILPLAVVSIFIGTVTRDRLIRDAQVQLQNDAKTRTQSINAYINERVLDAQTLTQVPSVQEFMAAPPPPKTPVATYKTLAQHAGYSLVAGTYRDKRYVNWSLFTTKGELLLGYPKDPKPHGQSLVQPSYLQATAQAAQTAKPVISEVYYDPDIQQATIDIYAPIVNAESKSYLGFMRATLNLEYVWTIVKDDTTGQGSYAFIVDKNGIRIADPDAQRRFSSIGPLSDDLQTQIKNEQRFGSSTAANLLQDDILARVITQDTQGSFQAQPAGKTELFQIAHDKTEIVPWHYFVLSPVNTVTAVANEQLLITGLAAAVAAFSMAVIGLIVGRRLARPIQFSVDALRRSSEAMGLLATKQQDAASEQMWVVDSSQVGLQSVQYYAEATAVAARELGKVAHEMTQRWGYLEANEAHKALEKITTAASYIERASHYQTVSNDKLATALKVATQVTEQLVAGTTSATDAATQMERVVTQLRHVVGK
jgi:methyl-accepting chemotaxis protein